MLGVCNGVDAAEARSAGEPGPSVATAPLTVSLVDDAPEPVGTSVKVPTSPTGSPSDPDASRARLSSSLLQAAASIPRTARPAAILMQVYMSSSHFEKPKRARPRIVATAAFRSVVSAEHH